jgi:hypothetical protein
MSSWRRERILVMSAPTGSGAQVTDEFAEGLTPTQTGPLPARHEQARALLERYICTLRKAGASLPTNAARSMPAGEPLPIYSGSEIIQILWPAQ